jgi:hypothetical protein
MTAGGLSSDAQRLLAQLDLPNGDPDELLASLDFTPAAERRASNTTSTTVAKRQGAFRPVGSSEREREGAGAGPSQTGKLVSVREDEWLRLQKLRREQSDRAAPGGPTPRWPGYVLLGLAGFAAGTATYALLHRSGLNDDPDFTAYRAQVALSDPSVTDACDAARSGVSSGIDPGVRSRAADVCNEADSFAVVFWVAVGATVTSAAVGTGWLLWVADDPAEPTAQTSVSLAVTPSFAGAQLRFQL